MNMNYLSYAIEKMQNDSPHDRQELLKEMAILLDALVKNTLKIIKQQGGSGESELLIDRLSDLSDVFIDNISCMLRSPDTSAPVRESLAIALTRIRSGEFVHLVTQVILSNDEDHVIPALGALLRVDHQNATVLMLDRLLRPGSSRLKEGILSFALQHALTIPPSTLDTVLKDHNTWGINEIALKLRK